MGKRKGTAILAALFLIAGLSAVGTATASATTPTTPTSPAVGTRHGLPAVGRIDGHVVRGLPPYSKAGVEPCSDNCGGYEYSSSFVPIGDLTDVTSGSVDMTDNGDEGNLENNDAWTGDHSLGDFVINGTCASGNTSCTSSPSLEITQTTGQEYCKSGNDQPCFEVFSWVNGNWTHEDGYVEASGDWGQPDDGTWHQPVSVAVDLGYTLTYGRINITDNGNIVGYFPDSYWGQSTYGPITEELVDGEVYEADANYGKPGLQVSMNYTFSDFKDSAGNTLPAPNTSTGYVATGESATGWTVSGGTSPAQSGTDWPIELSQDNSMCIYDPNNATANNSPVQIYSCNIEGLSELWRYNQNNGEIVQADGGCLDNPGNSQTNKTALVIYTCNDSAGEQWALVSWGNDFWDLEGETGNMCVNNLGNSTTNETPLYVYACTGTEPQQSDLPADS